MKQILFTVETRLGAMSLKTFLATLIYTINLFAVRFVALPSIMMIL